MDSELPENENKLCWAGLLFPYLWGPFSRVWISLLCFVPVLNIFMSFYLLFKGRKLAWKARKWESVEHFNQVQKKWTITSIALFVIIMGVGAGAYMLANGVGKYQKRAKMTLGKLALRQAKGQLEYKKIEHDVYPTKIDVLRGIFADAGSPPYKVVTIETYPDLRKFCPDCTVKSDHYKIAAIGNIDSDSQLDIWILSSDATGKPIHLVED